MPHHRLLAIVASASLLAGGCVSRVHPHVATVANATMGTGALLWLIGGIIGNAQDVTCEANRTNMEQLCVNELGDSVPGVAILAIGALIGVTVDAMNASSPAPPPPPRPPETPAPFAPPSSSPSLPPLPALATDDTTLALARQARIAALHGQCTAARVDLDAIAHRDAAYRDALAALPMFAPCR